MSFKQAVTPFAGVSYVRLASVAGSVRRGREAS
jgi:hypothetical protein